MRSFTDFWSPADLSRLANRPQPRTEPARRHPIPACYPRPCSANASLAAAGTRPLGGPAAGRDGPPARPRRRVFPPASRRSGAASSSRPVLASEIDKARARRVLRVEARRGASRRRSRTTFGPLAALGLIEETPGLLDHADRLLRLPGHRLLRPRAAAVLRRPGQPRRSRRGRRGDAGHGPEPHLLPRADARPAGRVAAPGRPDEGSSRRTATAASRCSACSRARRRCVMIRVALKDIPGRRRGGRGAAGAPAHGRRARAVQRAQGDSVLLRRPALLPVRRRHGVRPAAVKRGGWAEVDRLWRNPPESSAEILHGGPLPPPARACCRRTS